MSDIVNLAVVCYSSTGTGTAIANAIAGAAETAGAEVRVRKAAELAPQAAIDANPLWAAHHAATAGVPAPSADDLSWADAVIFGSPTRFGTSHHAVWNADLGSIDDDTRNAARHQANRVVRIARALKHGSAA